ncbi:MAG: type II secretion system protein N [Sulfuriferula sp.]
MALTVTITLLTVAALILLALIAAYWTWEWLAPRPEPRVQAANTASNITVANGLFGNLAQQPISPVATGIAIKLLGIVAASASQHGYAVMQIKAGEIRSVREGAEITPGLQLAEVNTDHVILERSGIRETLALPARKAATEPAAPQIKQ